MQGTPYAEFDLSVLASNEGHPRASRGIDRVGSPRLGEP